MRQNSIKSWMESYNIMPELLIGWDLVSSPYHRVNAQPTLNPLLYFDSVEGTALAVLPPG